MSATATTTDLGAPNNDYKAPLSDSQPQSVVPTCHEVEEAPGSNSIADVIADLTPDEERKMQHAWAHLARLCGHEVHDESVPDMTGILKPLLVNPSPRDFRMELWTAALPDNPDAAVLRFLRARKWDMQKSMEMIVSAINWRAEHQINEAIIRRGESVALKDSPTADDQGFIMQYRSGKAFVRGTDKEGRPVFVIRVRLHDPNKQSSKAMEDYVLHNIESIKTMLTFPNDKACLIFDMTGFGLKNMDFHVVRFLVQVFEARYPETLGVVLIHNAPFVFWGIWRIIRGWLDPVIAAKINFTSKPKDMLNFISAQNLQKCYDGDDTWEYKYIEPVTGENVKMEDQGARSEIEAEREELFKQYEAQTSEWLRTEPGSEDNKNCLAKRHQVARQLRANFWALDPHVRARTYYHRAGVVGPQGEIDFVAATG